MNMKCCYPDCFSCPFEDCINDSITVEEITASRDRDSIINGKTQDQIERARDYSREYYKRNKERMKEARRRYYRNHTQKEIAYAKNYYNQNWEKCRQAQANYRGKEKINEQNE